LRLKTQNRKERKGFAKSAKRSLLKTGLTRFRSFSLTRNPVASLAPPLRTLRLKTQNRKERKEILAEDRPDPIPVVCLN
jgi:hypothetical protein